MSIRLKIEKFAFGGEAMGHLEDGRVCFVRHAIPGETVDVEIIREQSRWCRARLIDVADPSPLRVDPVCERFGVCPGCSYMHVSYDEELRTKQALLDEQINRRRETPVMLSEPFAAPERIGWRDRISLHADSGKYGYRGFDNVSLVEVRDCAIAHQAIRSALACFQLPDGFSGDFGWNVSAGVAAARPGNENVLKGNLGQYGEFLYPADGFFQTNPCVAEELVRRVAEAVAVSGAERMLELYCGVGVFSIVSALKCDYLKCSGVEISRSAIALARRNAESRHLGNRCEFMASDVSRIAPSYWRRFRNARLVVVVDPPRGGLDVKTRERLLSLRPETLIYVSCAADTLVRDLKELEKDYDIAQAGLLDMFPCTAHFEVLVVMNRRRN
ncbi:MAG: TRAM domain-containing protein [Victivallaceae bacterium]|nr:TRAM domain-containing protein [Victivallaceae bacterium]